MIATKRINYGNWIVYLTEDDDGHLNVQILNLDSQEIDETDIELSAKDGEGVTLRFTTPEIEAQHELATTPAEH